MIPKFLKSDAKVQPQKEIEMEHPLPIHLNAEQEQALSHIKMRISENCFSEIFLFGVTGGGKSELYIRAIKEVLKRGKSAICLVPEIALTEQLKLFFLRHFHAELEILHSKLTDRDRCEAWHRIRRGEKRVILGARSAIFAPAFHLGLIILDEEQELGQRVSRVLFHW